LIRQAATSAGCRAIELAAFLDGEPDCAPGPTHTTATRAPTVSERRPPRTLAFYRDFLADSSYDVYAVFAFLTVPPGPPFPEHLHLQKVCGVFTGDVGSEPDRLSEAFFLLRVDRLAGSVGGMRHVAIPFSHPGSTLVRDGVT
jgi:hypothetical protein